MAKLQIQIMNLLEDKLRGQNSVAACHHHNYLELLYVNAPEVDKRIIDDFIYALTGKPLRDFLGLPYSRVDAITIKTHDLNNIKLKAKQEEKQRIAAYLREESAMHTALGSWLYAKAIGFEDTKRMSKALEAVAKKIEE